ncbi:DUF5701 family protein [Patescibacteria group bacterium AH-259-L05]|nr:DUF5701 family protein [Patescibacteria group bacterium AH-259-L05]
MSNFVDKLVDLFKTRSHEEINEAVTSAKERLDSESQEKQRETLADLFKAQLQTLKDRGCPEAIVSMFENQKSDVLAKAIEMTFGEENTPFLPVIPRTYASIYYQMPMVKNGSKTGYTYLDPAEITDVVETPNKPYYIFDVEDGEAMRRTSPKDAEKRIKKQNRRCLTEVEVIALGVHTDVLSRHYVDAAGSRYESDDVPGLYLSDGQPRLSYDWLVLAHVKWGSASCGSK